MLEWIFYYILLLLKQKNKLNCLVFRPTPNKGDCTNRINLLVERLPPQIHKAPPEGPPYSQVSYSQGPQRGAPFSVLIQADFSELNVTFSQR